MSTMTRYARNVLEIGVTWAIVSAFLGTVILDILDKLAVLFGGGH